jgi:lipid-binding SYLF domain-containing protein
MVGLKGAQYAAIVLGVSIMFIAGQVTVSYGKTAEEINASVNSTLSLFKKDVKGADEYLKAAKGVLVMPDVTKAAFIVGGQYGTGALRTGGKTAGYYRLVGGSLGYLLASLEKGLRWRANYGGSGSDFSIPPFLI